jgi:signal transduction histidine kinase
VAIGHDISRELQLEAGLRQAQRLEAIGQLAGGLAHDFNNLLTVILGSTDAASHHLSTDARDARERAARALREVRQSVESAVTLTRQLLALGRRDPVEPKPLDLSAEIERLVPLLRRTLGASIRLDVALPVPFLSHPL